MKIVNVITHAFEGDLNHPASNSRSVWMTRTGTLLQLVDELGNVGQGEASPLPDFSTDLPGICETTLGNLEPSLFPAFDLTGNPLSQVQEALSLVDLNAPAAKFALETALLDLFGQRLNIPIAALLRAHPHRDPIALSSVIYSEDKVGALAETEVIWGRGIRNVKIKIGRIHRFDRELEMIEAVRERFGKELAIRADVNGAWDLIEAQEKLEALAPLDLEYIEQPVVPYLLLKLGVSPIDVAADETVAIPGGVERLALVKSCNVLVLKPMVLGGAMAALRIAKIAQARKYGLVISHLFDGPVGLAAAMQLACALPYAPLACGLDEHPGLSIWPDALPAGMDKNSFRLDERPGLGLPLLQPVA